MSEPQDPPRVRLTHKGPLDATQLLALYVPMEGTPALTIVHDGPVTHAARKWAKRLEIELEDAPEAEDDGVPVVQLQPDGPPAPPPPPEPALLPAPTALPALPEHVELTVPAEPSVGSAPTVPEVPKVPHVPTEPAEPPVPAAPAEPAAPVEPPERPVPAAPHVQTDPPLPWDVSVPPADPAPAHVGVAELLAFPWNTVESLAAQAAEEDDHHEVLEGSSRFPTEHHPTSLLPQAPNWGLPWPRPVAPAGAVAKVDPALWHEPERLAAMREELEAKGAPSFGAVKPAEGASGWLKKLSDSG